MTNVIFSEILRKGHNHAVYWLDAFDPFYLTLVATGRDRNLPGQRLGLQVVEHGQVRQRARPEETDPHARADSRGDVARDHALHPLARRVLQEGHLPALGHRQLSDHGVVGAGGSQVQVAMGALERRQKEVNKLGQELATLASQWKIFKMKNAALFK